MTVGVPTVQQQGVGAINADNWNTTVQGALSVAVLRGVVGVSGQVVMLQGYSTAGDGGQGLFVWELGSSFTDDNGVTVVVPPAAVGMGAWLRLNLSALIANSVTNADLAQAPALTLKGNNTNAEANVADLTVLQVVAMLAGRVAGTLAAGNDSRFTAIGQTVVSINTHSLSLAEQAGETYFTYAGSVAVDIPNFGWTPSAVIVLRVAPGCAVTLTPDTGVTLRWVPSNSTTARTLTGPALATLTVASGAELWLGSGGIT